MLNDTFRLSIPHFPALLPPNPQPQGFFGNSVSVNGNNALIGSEIQGLAYLFDTVTGNLLQTFMNPTLPCGDLFGSSVALNDTYALISAPSDDSK